MHGMFLYIQVLGIRKKKTIIDYERYLYIKYIL